MRHHLSLRFVVIVTVLLAAAVLVWVVLAQTVVDPVGEARSDAVLELTGDAQRGEQLYTDAPRRPCASCHSFEVLGVSAEGGPPIEALQPTEREVVVSLLEGNVPAHEDYDYEDQLSNQQVADLAALIGTDSPG